MFEGLQLMLNAFPYGDGLPQFCNKTFIIPPTNKYIFNLGLSLIVRCIYDLSGRQNYDLNSQNL